jgi:hypothetical protein
MLGAHDTRRPPLIHMAGRKAGPVVNDLLLRVAYEGPESD